MCASPDLLPKASKCVVQSVREHHSRNGDLDRRRTHDSPRAERHPGGFDAALSRAACGSAGPLTGLADSQQIEPVRLNEKAAAPQPHPGDGLQEAAVRRFDRTAALANGVFVMPVGQSEVGDAADIDMFDQPPFPHPFQDAVGRDESERGSPAPRTAPDVLAGDEMAARRECFEDGDALRRDA